MFIRFFRSSFIIQYIVLGIISAVLWVPAFLDYQVLPQESPVTPLYNIIIRIIPDVNWLPVVIAMLLIFAEAFILNSIFIYHDLVPKNSLLTSFLFVVLMSSGLSTLTLYPAIIAMLPMTFFVHQLYQLYDEPENLNKMLGVGLLASFCSMIYAPMLLLIVFIWLTFLIYRTLQWREWAIALIGFTIPYLYLIVYYFWMEDLAVNAQSYLDYFLHLFNIYTLRDLWQISIWAVFFILMLLPSTFRVISSLGSHNIAFRRKMSLTIWMGIFGLFMIVIQGDIAYNTVIYIPAVGIIASYYHERKKSWWNEMVLLAYLVLIAVHHYLPFQG